MSEYNDIDDIEDYEDYENWKPLYEALDEARSESERLRELLKEVLPCLFVDQCYSELGDKIKKELEDE